MRIATYEGEKRMGELVSRLFNISGKQADARAAEAEAALREANPHLQDLGRVPVGTPVVVPDIPGVRPSKDSRPIQADAQALLETVRSSLGGIREALDGAVRERADAVSREAALLRSKSVQGVAAKDRTVGKWVRDLTEANQQARGEMKVLRKGQADAMTQLENDLEDFLRLHGGSG